MLTRAEIEVMLRAQDEASAVLSVMDEAFKQWWRVNSCCGLPQDDVETIWQAGYYAAQREKPGEQKD